jgi:hypothetical protein
MMLPLTDREWNLQRSQVRADRIEVWGGVVNQARITDNSVYITLGSI